MYVCACSYKLYKDCKDVLRTTDDSLLPAGTFGLNATSLVNRRRNSNKDIWRMADTLQQLAADGRDYSEKEKLYGLLYNPLGIIYDLSLRQVHKPVDSYIRDWMHILVSGGVANSQMLGLKDALQKEAGIPMSVVRDYSVQWTLPKQYGNVSPTWLDDARFEGDSFTSFASYLLTLIPIIGAFLVDNVRAHNVIEDHIECFLLLGMIVGLLSSGADFACQHLTLLAEYIVKHHKLYVRLYPGKYIKTKFHQMLHLPETYQRLKKVLSCFAATTWFVDTV
jgi:hypothetical protein